MEPCDPGFYLCNGVMPDFTLVINNRVSEQAAAAVQGEERGKIAEKHTSLSAWIHVVASWPFVNDVSFAMYTS